MTNLIWLAASSIAWGAVLCVAALLLQKRADLSGRTRQWMWRGATALLIAPWLAMPLVGAMGLGLARAPAQPIEITNAATRVADAGPQVSLAVVAASGATEAAQPSVIREASSWLPASLSWVELLVLIVLGGWLVRFVLAQLSARSLMGLVVNSHVVEQGRARESLARWSARLGLKRQPALRFGKANVSPFSFGILRPVICLPEGLDRKLNREALDLVVGHECLHIARGDGWRRPLERIGADIFWFNPFAWIMRRELDMARELACDEGVVEMCAAPKAYARTLRDVAGYASGLRAALPAASMSLAGPGRSLMVRVQRALAHGVRGPVRGGVVGVVAVVVCGMVGGGVAVAQAMLATPQRAVVVSAPMDMRVADVSGAQVRLVSVAVGENAACAITLNAMQSVVVAKGDVVRAGQAVGMRARAAVRVEACELDDVALARLAVQPAPPAPPAPVRAVVSGVAPVAPLAPLHAPGAPALRVAPAPAPQVAPVAPLQDATHPVVRGAATISSGYGNRTEPSTGKTAFHNGVDVAQDFNAPIYAPVNGTVTFAGTRGELGRMVEITANDGYVLRLGHLNAIVVKTNDKVAAGAEIGSMGSVGRGDGSHVHVEVERNGRMIDPMTARGLILSGRASAPLPAPMPSLSPSPLSAPSPRPLAAPLAPLSPAAPPSGASPAAPPAPLSPPSAASPPAAAAPPAPAASPAPPAPPAPAGWSAPATPRTPAVYQPQAPLIGGALAVKVRQQVGAAPQLERTPIVFVLSDSKPMIAARARPTSGFGYRLDPNNGREVFHAGVDIGADLGTPIYAPTAGRVTFTGERQNCGRAAELTLANGTIMRFCRLDSVAVSAGHEVVAGTQIGAVGMDEQSTGPHLHFEVIQDGKAINPASVGNLVMIGG